MRTRGPARDPAVAGSFYPDDPAQLDPLVTRLLAEAGRLPGVCEDAEAGHGMPAAILVPHAGLVYSGVTAAAAWACLAEVRGGPPTTVVLLGTNHTAAWLRGVGAWEEGRWVTPAGTFAVDGALADAILALGPPYRVDRDAHTDEHSIEVQLPLLAAVAPDVRIVPLAVATGTGAPVVQAGERLGRLLAGRRATGERVVLAISSDMAHYPPADACREVTEALLPAILDRDPVALALLEDRLRNSGIRGLACGMCGIEPAVLGLAAVRAMGVGRGSLLAASTSSDAGGPANRTVGYLAVRFDAPTLGT